MKRRASHIPGFTIVELLIVIVVIAILAAITIVAYTGVQQRADETVVQNDISQLARKMDLWKIDHNDVYPAVDGNQLASVGISISSNAYLQDSRNNFYYCSSADGTSYSFGIVSKNNQGYFLTNGTVSQQSGGSTYQTQTCAQVGEPSTTGTSGYVGGSDTWASWIDT
ncbi:TPA: hypothetical protein DD425_03355 [Candidatus Saccharibacteria bacterium]|nr:hypothetical protein [Candidatus Saccharibacteria bacterium]|tara:strand:- start:508 stop:1011 length:504 start_codon:yes stop_codon:yes gene_type:complete